MRCAGLAFAAVSLLGVDTAYAQSFDLGAQGEDNVIFDLNADRRLELGTSFTLRIPNTPEHIQNAHILDDQGREIQFRLLLDQTEQWVLGTHQDDIQIELLHKLDDGTFVISGRKQGQVFILKTEDLFVTDLEWGEQCFELAGLEDTDVPVNIGIALDISGSMDGVLAQVAGSFQSFIREAPEAAHCKVAAFDHDSMSLDPIKGLTLNPPSYRACSDYRDFSNQLLQSRNGGTKVASALTPFYQDFLTRDDEINLMLVVSDGVGGHDKRKQIAGLEAARNLAVERAGVYTIVNWLGGYDTGYPLARLADQSIYGAATGQAGRSFFDQSLRTVQAQSVLRMRDCKAGE
jgi:hypothetical protein